MSKRISLIIIMVLIFGCSKTKDSNTMPPESFLNSNLRTIISGNAEDGTNTIPLELTLKEFLAAPVPLFTEGTNTWKKGEASKNEWILNNQSVDHAANKTETFILVFQKPSDESFKGDVVLVRAIGRGMESSPGQVANLAIQITAEVKQE